jgi:hypothetical protein
LGAEWRKGIIDAKAFDWVERLEKNSEVIRQVLVALLYEQKHLPNIQEISPRQTNLSRNDGWKSYFFFVLGHRIDESYARCPETGKLLDSIPGLSLAFFRYLRLEYTSRPIVGVTRVGWLTLVNKTVLNLAYYLPEVRRAVRSQREWEARSSAPTSPSLNREEAAAPLTGSRVAGP